MTLQTIDSVRAFWDKSPCFTKRSAAPKDSKQFMDETEARKFKSEPHIPSFAEYGKWIGKYVLEIGTGIGIDAVNFARAGANVTAIDLSEKSLELTKKRAYLANVPITLIRANAEDPLPVPDPAYHLIYAFGSIHHSPNPEAILRELRRHAASGTILKLMVYNRWSWKSLWVLLKYGHGKFWKFSELIARYSEAQTGCPITHTFSKRELRAMLERNGFHVRSIKVDHIFPWDIESYKRFEYKLAAPWKYLPDKFRFWLEKKIGWHLLAECTV